MPTLTEQAAALDASAAVERTPCGEGHMVWRRWGAGPPVVLLHGGSGSWRHWVRNVGTLARTREVWCADLPGLGDSAMPPPPRDVEAVVAATADGLDRLLPGPRAFDLVGFSFGGRVATAVAHLRPGRVRRLVLVGVTSLGLPRPEMGLRGWRHLADPAERLATHAHNLGALMLASGADDPETIALHAASVERSRFNSRREADRPVIRDRLAGVDVERVDAIYGELDATAFASTDGPRRALRALRPELRFVGIPAAGHWVQFEAAEAFDAALASLLDRGPVPASS